MIPGLETEEGWEQNRHWEGGFSWEGKKRKKGPGGGQCQWNFTASLPIAQTYVLEERALGSEWSVGLVHLACITLWVVLSPG